MSKVNYRPTTTKQRNAEEQHQKLVPRSRKNPPVTAADHSSERERDVEATAAVYMEDSCRLVGKYKDGKMEKTQSGSTFMEGCLVCMEVKRLLSHCACVCLLSAGIFHSSAVKPFTPRRCPYYYNARFIHDCRSEESRVISKYSARNEYTY